MAIKILSKSTINKIAAGEIIERPSAVVKELIENAIDASATKIEISLQHSGKNFIRVSDNGCGISPEDLELLAVRHATSKLIEEDLYNINTFGFRGEALASISSVSKLKITTKSISSDLYDMAYQINFHPQIQIKRIASNYGTMVEVQDIFYTTPARLKFLKSDRAELIACIHMIKRISLANHQIAFRLLHNDIEIFSVEKTSNVTERIYNILGNEEHFLFIPSIEFSLHRDNFSICYALSKPHYYRNNSDDQYFFVNNRPIRDRNFSMILKNAYRDLIPVGKYPIVALFLNLDPIAVDVNVHPTKAEVRFQNPTLIQSELINSLKKIDIFVHKTMYANQQFTLDLNNTEIDQKRGYYLAKNFALNRKFHNRNEKENSLTLLGNQFIFPKIDQLNSKDFHGVMDPENASVLQVAHDYLVVKPNLANDLVDSFGNFCGKIFGTNYLLSSSDCSIFIIDAIQAQNKIMFEVLKKEFAFFSKNSNQQTSIILSLEDIIIISNIDEIKILNRCRLELEDLGWKIDYSQKKMIINAIPAVLTNYEININSLLQNLAKNLNYQVESDQIKNCIISVIAESLVISRALDLNHKNVIFLLSELANNLSENRFKNSKIYMKLNLKDLVEYFNKIS